MIYNNEYHISQEDIDAAKNSNQFVGLMKYLYYISPVGYMFSSDKHFLALKLTKDLYNEKLVL